MVKRYVRNLRLSSITHSHEILYSTKKQHELLLGNAKSKTPRMHYLMIKGTLGHLVWATATRCHILNKKKQYNPWSVLNWDIKGVGGYGTWVWIPRNTCSQLPGHSLGPKHTHSLTHSPPTFTGVGVITKRRVPAPVATRGSHQLNQLQKYLMLVRIVHWCPRTSKCGYHYHSHTLTYEMPYSEKGT